MAEFLISSCNEIDLYTIPPTSVMVFTFQSEKPGYGKNGTECVACGEGAYSGYGESSCTSRGPNTNTGGNENATDSSQYGE